MLSDKQLKNMAVASLVVLAVLLPFWYFQDDLWGSTTQLVWFHAPPCTYDSNGFIENSQYCYGQGWGTICQYRFVQHRWPLPDYRTLHTMQFSGNVTCP